MRKTILNKMLFALFFLSSYMGFSQTYNVRVNTTYDMLSFTAASDYTAVISPDARTRDDFSAWLSRNVTFSSLYSNQTNTLYPVLSDDYIEKIVNKNGFVQIGSYVYKVDPTYSVTAVIHINNLNDVIQSEMIAHNYRNANIRSYSLVEEVVTMVESGINPSGRLFCGDGGVGTKEANKHIDLFPPSGGATCGWVDCWVKYLAAGIYFHMYARYNNTCSYRTIYIHKTPVSKIIKCGATSGPYYQWDIPTGNVLGVNWTDSYHNSVQPLSALWLRIVFMAKDINWIGNPNNPSADLEIRIGM